MGGMGRVKKIFVLLGFMLIFVFSFSNTVEEGFQKYTKEDLRNSYGMYAMTYSSFMFFYFTGLKLEEKDTKNEALGLVELFKNTYDKYQFTILDIKDKGKEKEVTFSFDGVNISRLSSDAIDKYTTTVKSSNKIADIKKYEEFITEKVDDPRYKITGKRLKIKFKEVNGEWLPLEKETDKIVNKMI